MTPRPAITVGIPVHNGEAHLPDSLDSLLAQELRDDLELEILVSDNASTDATPDICRAYQRRDDRIRYVRQASNVGAAANFNLLVEAARAPLYKSLSHDDVLAPTLLQRCADALAEHRDAVLAFAGTRIIDGEGRIVGDEDAPVRWTHAASPSGRLRDLFDDHARSHLHHCLPVMGVIRTDALRSTRLIQPFQSSDTVLLVELALRGDFAEVPERLSLKRRHAGTSVAANRTPEAIAAWFDPAAAGRGVPMPRTRLLRAYADAVRRAPVPLDERARCLVEVARWLGRERRWRVVGGEVRRWARAGLGRAPTPTRAAPG